MTLQHMMQRLGRILAADELLEVHVRGDRPYSEPGRVVLPTMEFFDSMPGISERLLHGVADHEIGHAVDTDFEVSARAAEQSAVLHQAWNAIEDAYVERRRCLRYPGCRYNLRVMRDWLWEAGGVTEEVRSKGRSLAVRDQISRADNLWGAFLLGLGYLTVPEGGRSIEAIESLNPDVARMLRMVDEEIREIRSLVGPKQSAECLAIAERILERFKDDECPKSIARKQWKAVRESIDAFAGDAGKMVLTPQDAITRAITNVLRPEYPECARTTPYVVFDPSFDLEREFQIDDAARTAAYDRCKSEAAEATDALVLAFESALRARREVRPVQGIDDGNMVDPTALPSYAVGALSPDDIWIDYAAEDDRAVAVAVLIDCSGSMSGSPAELARLSAIAMHEALKRVQIPHELTGFTTIESVDYDIHSWVEDWSYDVGGHFDRLRRAAEEAEAHGTNLRDFARTCETSGSSLLVPIYGIFKGFDTEDGRGLMSVAGLDQNLDGEAVLWQARRLAMRSEPRRVMFVLSDGYPAGSHCNVQGARYLRESIRRIVDAGIEIYGIGMKSEAVTEFYPRSWVCHDLHDLAHLAMTALTEVVADGRVEQQWVEGLP